MSCLLTSRCTAFDEAEIGSSAEKLVNEPQLCTPPALTPHSYQEIDGTSNSLAVLTGALDFKAISAGLTPNKSLDEVFSAFGLDLEAERQLLQPSFSRSIQELFDTHNAISQILERLGLPGFRDDPAARGKYQHAGGLELMAKDVLSHGLGWSVATYSKKSRAFIWAENIHKFQWRDSEPTGAYFE